MSSSIYGGLDLSQLDSVSPEELADFAAFYVSRHGREHPGLSFMLAQRADALKGFRLYVRTAYDVPGADELLFSVAPGFLLYYAHLGYAAGVRYVLGGLQSAGFSRDDCRDVLGLAGLVVGPAGFETIALALGDYSWIEQQSTVTAPSDWNPDLSALEAGLDFSEPELLPGELDRVEAWYANWLGEVPAWVGFLSTYHPRALKVQRLRFERALRVLPKQTLPLALLHFRLMRGDTQTIRETLLMARGFGVSKQQIIRTIAAGIEYGGDESVAAAAAIGSDVLGAWEEPI
jgi:hypothetical protein